MSLEHDSKNKNIKMHELELQCCGWFVRPRHGCTNTNSAVKAVSGNRNY